jgi:general secretion pathway protein G
MMLGVMNARGGRDWAKRCLSERQSFTLVELLTALAIISILGVLLMQGVRHVRQTTNTVVCMNNLRQLGLAFQYYSEANDGCLPYPNASYGGPDAHPEACWFNALDSQLFGLLPATGKSTERLHRTKQDPVIEKLGRKSAQWSADAHTLKMNEWLTRAPDGAVDSEYFWRVAEFRNASMTVLLFDGKAETSVTGGGLPGTVAKQTQGTEGEVMPRHQQKANVLFVDGHVEIREEKRQTSGDKQGWKVNETRLIWKPWLEPR